MSDPETPPPAPLPQPPAIEHSIWRTLDGTPIPRRATAAAALRSAGVTLPPNLTKPLASGQVQFHQRGQQPGAQLGPSAFAPAAAAAPMLLTGPRLVLATWWSRAGAFLIDGVLLGLATLLVTVPLCLAGGMTIEQAFLFLGLQQMPETIASPDRLYAVLVLQLLAPPVIASVMLTRWNGQTIGKQALGIRVVRANGSPLTLRDAVRREVLGKTMLLSLLALVSFGLAWVVNYLWPLWDPESRAGHDFLAGTRVIQAPRNDG